MNLGPLKVVHAMARSLPTLSKSARREAARRVAASRGSRIKSIGPYRSFETVWLWSGDAGMVEYSTTDEDGKPGGTEDGTATVVETTRT